MKLKYILFSSVLGLFCTKTYSQVATALLPPCGGDPNCVRYYTDNDGDNYGTSPSFWYIAGQQPSGLTPNSGDCNDNNSNINPLTKWYKDNDGDGYGNSLISLTQCTQPIGYVLNNTDCDDTNASILNTRTWYLDSDHDGYGSTNVIATQCSQPTNGVLNNLDCNDTDASIKNPQSWYADADADGFGDPSISQVSCTQPTGYVSNNLDNCPTLSGPIQGCIIPVVPPSGGSGFGSDQNYIITTTPKIPVSSLSQITDSKDVNINITYFDGLGRPMQHVAHGQSATGKDIISHIEYDAFGRQAKEYLPYTKWYGNTNMEYVSSAQSETMAYYSSYSSSVTGNPNFDQTNYPFSEKGFEASPLNRVLKQAAPGNDWILGSNHEIRFDYQTNVGSGVDAVRLYKATATWSNTTALYDIALVNATGTVFYPANSLYQTITKNENWVSGNNNTTQEFKDKEGRVVLKRTYDNSVAHDTYYIYDPYGNLTYVIPPKAPTSITAAILNDLCYQYKYDARNRLVEKKLPGKQWEFIVYDKLNRVVATGPALSPFSDLTGNGWMLTKYDAFNRVVYTAWWPSTTVTSAGRKTLQDSYSATGAVVNESKIATATNTTVNGVAFRYTNGAYPNVTTFHVLTVNYYDDYNFPNVATLPTTVETQTVAYDATVKPKGLATGGWIRALETSTLYKGETNTVVYDYKARPLRQYTQNYLGGYTQVDTRYDFVKTLYTVTRHKRLSTDTELMTKDEFTYTNQDRLLTHTHQINALPKQLLVKNEYDELGQLITKKVGGTDVTGVTALQKVDYSYNIRGWLTGINDTNNLAQGTDPQDLFAFKINYNTVQGIVPGVIALYNGNIAETYWRTASDNIKRKYGYKYDNLNRLKDAIYQRPDDLNPTPNNYNETLGYDKNGNITSLSRIGDSESPGTPFQIDKLVYNYGTDSNILVKITDISNIPSGFKDGANNPNEYRYDANGNMTRDDNKGITIITYNHLNLPTGIGFSPTSKINYLYSATGKKLRKIVVNGSTATATDYLDGFQYRQINTGTVALDFFPHAEGYVAANKYVFQYKDHLGNVRLSYSDANGNGAITTNEIVEQNHYYPFGLKHNGYNNTATSTNPALKYKYNGKEYQDELGLNMYDYGNRLYDPTDGRWWSIDPLIELMRDNSTYSYGFNNPIYFEDFEGSIPIPQIVRSSRTSSGFGLREHPIRKKMIGHGGIDLVAPVGNVVNSAAIGTVAKIGWDPDGYGHYIVVKHINGYYSLYGHLSSIGNGISVGTSVGNGEAIGLSGNSGGSTGPHLHFEIIKAKSLAGVFNKSNKVNPTSIYDLNEMLYPNKRSEIKFNGDFNHPRFDFSSILDFNIPHFDYSFKPTSTSGGSRTPVTPLPSITPQPIVPTPSPLPTPSPTPIPLPAPAPTPAPTPVIPSHLPNRID